MAGDRLQYTLREIEYKTEAVGQIAARDRRIFFDERATVRQQFHLRFGHVVNFEL
jgi:hypothetical protein